MHDMISLPASHVYPHAEARPLDKKKVAALAESVGAVGLLNPIIVRKAMKIRHGRDAEAWEILAGHHRYEACAVVLKWAEVPCVVREEDDLRAELIMIDENLCRAELSPAQSAYQTTRRKEIYEALHPEARAQVRQGHIRQGAADDKLSPAFTDATAEATGRDKRTIQRDAARGEALGDALKDIAGTSLDKGVELDALAKLPESERQDIVARAKNGESISARALKTIKPAPLADEPLNDFEAKEKQVAALMAAWNKAGKEAREEFMDRVGAAPVMDRRWA